MVSMSCDKRGAEHIPVTDGILTLNSLFVLRAYVQGVFNCSPTKFEATFVIVCVFMQNFL